MAEIHYELIVCELTVIYNVGEMNSESSGKGLPCQRIVRQMRVSFSDRNRGYLDQEWNVLVYHLSTWCYFRKSVINN